MQPLYVLPDGWKQNLSVDRRLGSEWLRSKRSLCLRVPSAVIPDFNYLLNPLHPEIALIKVISVKPFEYDRRLFER